MAKTEGRYRVEVIADSSYTWAGNGLRFDTVPEAVEHGKDLSSRWVLVRCARWVDTETGVAEVFIRDGRVEPEYNRKPEPRS